MCRWNTKVAHESDEDSETSIIPPKIKLTEENGGFMKVSPCNCGNQPQILTKYSDGSHYFSVICLKCYTESESSLSKDRAIKNWNKGIYKEESDAN